MTKPTREQQQACDRLAEAVLLVTSAARLDGRSAFGPAELRALLLALGRASSVFGPDEFVARALEHRGKALGLRNGTAELLGLIEGDGPGDTTAAGALLLDDDAFRARVAFAEASLGDVV